MQQMAPINWLCLCFLIFFFYMFIIFNMMKYYFLLPTSSKSLSYKSTKNMFNWKW